MGTGFSFELVDAVDYDELRPGYAPEAADWIFELGRLATGSLVVDLAAGTGQVSRVLGSRDCRTLAVEPAANMGSLLRDRVGVDVVAAHAEHLPFADGVVDAVVVGNAFHHFDADLAFAELHRVLRPRGVLAILWARAAPDAFDDPIIQRINEVASVRRDRSPIVSAAAYRDWYDFPAAPTGFTAFERRRFPVSHVIPSARYADLYATSSDVVALPSSERAALLHEIAQLAESLPVTLHLRAETEADICIRI